MIQSISCNVRNRKKSLKQLCLIVLVVVVAWMQKGNTTVSRNLFLVQDRSTFNEKNIVFSEPWCHYSLFPLYGQHCCLVVYIIVIQQQNIFFNWMNRPSDDSSRRIKFGSSCIHVNIFYDFKNLKPFFVVVVIYNFV